MSNRFIAAAAVAAVLAVSTGAHADDDRHHRRDSHRGERVAPHVVHVEPVRARHDRVRKVVQEVQLHRRVANDVLPLRALAGLDRDYRGYRVQKVVVHVKPRKSRGRVRLLANGAPVDRESARHDRVIRLYPDDDRTLGRDLRSLQLDVRGSVFIRDIEIHLRKAPRHAYRRISDDRRADEIARVILAEIARFRFPY